MRQIGNVDLVLVRRIALLKQSSQDVVTLLSAIDSGVFVRLATITQADMDAALLADKVRATEIEAMVERGTPAGFGLMIANNGSLVVCKAVAQSSAAHDLLLKPFEAQIADELKNKPTYVTTSADAAFISARRGECGAIYASSADLKALAAALRRERVPARFLSIWLDSEALEAAQKSLAERESTVLRQQTEQERRKADEQKLASAKANDADVVRARLQDDLQRQNRAPAKAFEVMTTAEMRQFLEGVTPDRKASSKRRSHRIWAKISRRDDLVHQNALGAMGGYQRRHHPG